MQNSLPVPHTLAEFVYLSIVGIFASLGTYFATRKSKTDNEHTKAETRRIDLDAAMDVGGTMLGLIKESGRLALDAERSRQQKEYWEQRCLTAERDKATAEAARELAENQLDEHIRIGRNAP